MNGGIIRKALSTTLALELEYREPSVLCEVRTESAPGTESQDTGQLPEDGLMFSEA